MRLVVGFLCLQSPFPVVTAGRSTFATTARATARATAATCRADVRLHVVIETFLPLEDLSALQTGVRRGFAVNALVPQQVHAQQVPLLGASAGAAAHIGGSQRRRSDSPPRASFRVLSAAPTKPQPGFQHLGLSLTSLRG